MGEQFGFFITIWFKFTFLFAPFFVLTMFLSMTTGAHNAERRKLALRVTGAIAVLSVAVFLFGNIVFSLLGITLDAFRVGAGVLLFLSAVQLVQSKRSAEMPRGVGEGNDGDHDDIAVVPLAMPIVIGPAVIGTLMVFGSEYSNIGQKGIGIVALLFATLTTGIILLLGTHIERVLGKRGLRVMSKITGLILSAMAAQMILSGVKNFIQLP